MPWKDVTIATEEIKSSRNVDGLGVKGAFLCQFYCCIFWAKYFLIKSGRSLMCHVKIFESPEFAQKFFGIKNPNKKTVWKKCWKHRQLEANKIASKTKRILQTWKTLPQLASIHWTDRLLCFYSSTKEFQHEEQE